MKSSECKCVVCGKQAVAFWPVVDPDIPSLPYCRKCLDKIKIATLMEVFDFSEEESKAFIENQNNDKSPH